MYPQSVFCAKILKIALFSTELFILTADKKSLYIAWASFRNVCQQLRIKLFNFHEQGSNIFV